MIVAITAANLFTLLSMSVRRELVLICIYKKIEYLVAIKEDFKCERKRTFCFKKQDSASLSRVVILRDCIDLALISEGLSTTRADSD